MYYIAYGSNLSIEQMKVRTPDAVIVGTGMLQGWRLLFRKFATIKKSKNFNTPVLIWDISEQDEKNLDRYEGFPNFYIKKNVKVRIGRNNEEIKAMVYIMTPEAVKARIKEALPSEYYYSLLAHGYQDFGFDENILLEALQEAQRIM